MSTKIGSAVIGHGGMGHFHSARMAENPELDFIGAYDILPERLADLPNGGKAYGSLEELLADDRISLVTVATPNDVHKEIVIQALAAGKNVISEKPVTMTLADLDDMKHNLLQYTFKRGLMLPVNTRCVFHIITVKIFLLLYLTKN